MLRMVKVLFILTAASIAAHGQNPNWQPNLTQQQTYKLYRASSTDPQGANADSRMIAPGATLTILDTAGSGMVSHIWFTMADQEKFALKKVVMRMYWDNEPTPSVETPLGDFFGLGTGTYYTWQSEMLSVGSSKSLNCFFPMPFQHNARITITNQGTEPVSAFYYNIEYRIYPNSQPADTLYFHAQYRQAQPNHGWTSNWVKNSDPLVDNKPNLDGADNYVWMEATGHGQYAGVTMSVLQNQNGWWGEGDDMFFIDGAPQPSITGTGTEDYFLGAWDFQKPFSYQLYGAPVVGPETAGSTSSVYRFHLDSPIPFSSSFKASIEHGHANHRSDNFYSVAYWYQSEPHAAFPPLPSVEERIPQVLKVGGPAGPSVPAPPAAH